MNSNEDSHDINETDIIAVNNGEWRDWTSTWRKTGNTAHSRHVTVTGTITRGKKKGQSVDVELDLTDHELMQMTTSRDGLNSTSSASTSNEVHKHSECTLSLSSGPQIIVLGIICFPFIFIGALFISFYFGLLTWQNIFNHFYEERTICHRIVFCPVLVLLFPILIVGFSLTLSVYAAFIQVFSWSYDDWKNEVSSFEKGFYGWLCSSISLEFCSPYMVVTLADPERPVIQNHRDGSNVAHVAVIEDAQLNNEEQNLEVHSSNLNRDRVLPDSTEDDVLRRMESAM